MINFNINHSAVVYPSPKGWIAMKEKYFDIHKGWMTREESEKSFNSKIVSPTTEMPHTGYKEQFWVIMQDYASLLFYNGSQYLEHTTITLIPSEL